MNYINHQKESLFIELVPSETSHINGGGRFRRKFKRFFRKVKKGLPALGIGALIALGAVFTGGKIKFSEKNGGPQVGGEWEY